MSPHSLWLGVLSLGHTRPDVDLWGSELDTPIPTPNHSFYLNTNILMNIRFFVMFIQSLFGKLCRAFFVLIYTLYIINKFTKSILDYEVHVQMLNLYLILLRMNINVYFNNSTKFIIDYTCIYQCVGNSIQNRCTVLNLHVYLMLLFTLALCHNYEKFSWIWVTYYQQTDSL